MHHVPVNSTFYKAWKDGKEARQVYVPTGRPATPGMLKLLKRVLESRYHKV
jgi:hypothetical protein